MNGVMKKNALERSIPVSPNVPETKVAGLQSHQSYDLGWFQIILDTLISGVALYLCVLNYPMEYTVQYQALTVMMSLLLVIYYNGFKISKDIHDAASFAIALLKAWLAVLVTLVAFGFITKTSAHFSREIIILWAGSAYMLQFASHFLVNKYIAQPMGSSMRERALLIGAGDLGRRLAERINGNRWIHSDIVGVIDDDVERLASWNFQGVEKLGGMGAVEQVMAERNITTVYIALPLSSAAQIEKIYFDLLPTNVDVKWVPDLLGMTLINPNVKEVGGLPVFALSETPLNGVQAAIKSAFDKTLAATALFIFSPVMALTALAIKISMPGPVFFKQRRHGWNGKIIEVYKFRSMVLHKEEEGNVTQATPDDKRVTRLGRILRKTSVDELPQLFNVLRGEMSMVGPRPHAEEHNNFYSERIHAYMARHRIKPGITGLAQVSGYRGRTETLEKMKRRVELDLEYINSWSLALDVKILLKTIPVLWSDEAY